MAGGGTATFTLSENNHPLKVCEETNNENKNMIWKTKLSP